jgi:hypothetical protein
MHSKEIVGDTWSTVSTGYDETMLFPPYLVAAGAELLVLVDAMHATGGQAAIFNANKTCAMQSRHTNMPFT